MEPLEGSFPVGLIVQFESTAGLDMFRKDHAIPAHKDYTDGARQDGTKQSGAPNITNFSICLGMDALLNTFHHHYGLEKTTKMITEQLANKYKYTINFNPPPYFPPHLIDPQVLRTCLHAQGMFRFNDAVDHQDLHPSIANPLAIMLRPATSTHPPEGGIPEGSLRANLAIDEGVFDAHLMLGDAKRGGSALITTIYPYTAVLNNDDEWEYYSFAHEHTTTEVSRGYHTKFHEPIPFRILTRGPAINKDFCMCCGEHNEGNMIFGDGAVRSGGGILRPTTTLLPRQDSILLP